MGYRSEVGLALLEEDYNKLLKLAEPFIKLYGENAILSDKPSYFTRDGEKYIYFHWDAIKWYLTYDEVRLITDFLKDHPHSFLRIGEDYDDIEYDVKDDDTYDFLWCIQYPKREVCLWEKPDEQTDNGYSFESGVSYRMRGNRTRCFRPDQQVLR